MDSILEREKMSNCLQFEFKRLNIITQKILINMTTFVMFYLFKSTTFQLIKI